MRKARLLVPLLLGLGLLLPGVGGSAPASTGGLSGRIVLVDKAGKPVASSAGDPRHAVVSLTTASPRPVDGSGRIYEMVTRGKEFLPLVLPVPRGATVRFPNQDPILHNVFSVSPGNPFDLGLYTKGPGKSWTFKSAGVVRVFCNVHHAMVAYIVVLDTPHFVVPGADGRFSLGGGNRGRLTVWHPQANPLEIDLTGGPPPEIRLTLIRERVPPHLNKAGKAYARPGRDRYDG